MCAYKADAAVPRRCMGVYMSTCSSRLMEILGQADAHGGENNRAGAAGGGGQGGTVNANGAAATGGGGGGDARAVDRVGGAIIIGAGGVARRVVREVEDDDSDDEMHGETAGDRSRRAQAGGLRSIDSLVSTHIHFKNRSTVPVKLFWINYDGDEVPYRTLQLGQSCRQQTFVTHPWTFRSASLGQPVACKKRTVRLT